MKHSLRVNQREQLPREPGVYYFIDREGTVLYVGKATSLRSRVASYWAGPLDGRLERILPEITTIRYRQTDTALEALILEANEIQRLNPPVNVRGTHSTTFAQIALTKETFPRLLIVRPTQKVGVPLEQTFGPYVSGRAARNALKVLRSIFKFNCKGTPRSGRPCLDYQLGLCPGVCVGAMTPGQYRIKIRKVVQFLEGKKRRLIATTRRQMGQAARNQEYERAAALRNELFALEHIRDTAFMTDDSIEFLSGAFPARLEAYDISNIGSTAAVASMVVLEHARPNPSQYKQFRIRSVTSQNDVAMIREVLTRRLNHLTDWGRPDFILIDGGVAQLNAASRVLRLRDLDVPVAGVVKGPDRKLARLVLSESAKQYLNDRRLTTQLFEPLARLARDEAHRFAVKYHRAVRARKFTK